MTVSHAESMHPLLRRVPRLQTLAVFECAARRGSFTAAAVELGMTQSGVSRQVTALERSISTALFERRGNSVQLNPAGVSLLSSVQVGLDVIDRGLNDIVRRTPTFLLAANPGYAQRFLIPHRESLQEALGDVELRLRLFDRDSELGDDDFDAAIHLTRDAALPVGSRRLFVEDVVPVASPECAARHGLDDSSDPARLLDVELLHLDGRGRQWMGWTEWFAAHRLQWSPSQSAMSYNNYALVVDEALAGRGVALAWRGLVDGALDAGLLVEVGRSVCRDDAGYALIPGPSADPVMVGRVAEWLQGLLR